ncbi:MAG: T9SS type A sorting domain-containing protein, partial [Fibrobacterota bacterium]
YNITYHHGGEFLKWNGSSYAVYDGKDYSVIDHAWNDSLCVVFALSGFHTTSSTPYDSACYILMDENNVLSVDTCGDIYRPSCPTSWTTYNTDIVMKLSIDGDYIYAIERMTLSSQSLVRRRISSGFQVSGTLELPSFTSARNYSYTVMGDCLYLYSSDSLTAYSKDLQSRLWSKYIPNDVRHTSNQTFNYDVSLSNRNFAHQKIASSDGRLYLTTDSSLQVRSASDGSLSFEHIFTDLPEYRTNTSGATVKGLPGDVILMPDYVVICSWYDESRVWVFEQDFSDETAPDFPSGLNSSVSGYSVNLSWTASSDAESGISGYEIYRGTSPSPSTLLKTLGNYTEYTDSTGEENMVFYYRLKAVNGAGLKSGFSGETSARTAADTEAPTIVSVSASGDPNTVKVVFSENVSSETAENPTNYSIDGGITVNSASLSGGNEVFLMVSTMNEQTYTLTVNNVADLASNPNQIISGSESVFTFVAQLDVSFISYSGTNETPVLVPDGYIEDCLQALDRNDTYTGVPASLSGCTYLRTARDDKSDAAGEDVVYYEVSLSAACTVFVPCQADQPLPGWISGDGWLDGGRTVNVGSHSHNLYYKVLPSGTAGLKRTTNGSTQGTGYIFKLSSGTGIVETHGSASLQYGLPGITVSPNPFNPSTVISVTGVYVSSDSELIIYNSQGRIVSRPELTVVQRGTFCKKYIWDASGMPAGVYLATVISGSGSQSERLTKKIVLMK